jgi:hypothetical protein
MPQTAHLDPLDVFMAGHRADRVPVPLVAVSHDIALEGGLALVTTTRQYRNAEAASIEAVLTFPVPVQAVVHGLEARIDGRRLRGTARRRAAARERYEQAIDAGKAAVLHEEVLRGVHMISVGQLGPGAEIEVVTRWAASLTVMETDATLRIPQTVGQIYGTSPLAEPDDLLTGGAALAARLNVRGAVAHIAGAALDESGRGTIGTDRPIDLHTALWPARTLAGRAADGRAVELTIAAAPAAAARLDVAILVDRSSSMDGGKHAAARQALTEAARRLHDGDAISLWQFDNEAEHLGRAHDAAAAAALVARLAAPRGGTEIGGALAAVLRHGAARDILVLTDGQSHALDVQALARHGVRISAVLIGAAALEARIGHLAALSGGDVFVATDDDAGRALQAALASLRHANAAARHDADSSAVTRGGARVQAQWRTGAAANDDAARAIGAFAAALRLPHLDADAAAVLAEREGLVTHLTSLVLVDEAGAVQDTLPNQRRIALPDHGFEALMALDDGQDAFASAELAINRAPYLFSESLASIRPRRAPMLNWSISSTPPARIDWGRQASRLVRGDIAALDEATRRGIEALAARADLIATARRYGVAPLLLAIGLRARRDAARDRMAARIARNLLHRVPEAELQLLGDT